MRAGSPVEVPEQQHTRCYRKLSHLLCFRRIPLKDGRTHMLTAGSLRGYLAMTLMLAAVGCTITRPIHLYQNNETVSWVCPAYRYRQWPLGVRSISPRAGSSQSGENGRKVLDLCGSPGYV